MRVRLFWCITVILLCHPRAGAQAVTTQFPPAAPGHATSAAVPGTSNPKPAATAQDDLPDDPSLQSSLPEAHVVPQPPAGVPELVKADEQGEQSVKNGTLYTLDGDVVIYYRNYIVHADHATYNDGTGEIVARGHLMIDGGPDDEHFVASHGTVNVQADTGDFFDVVGTLGVERTPRGRMVFTAPNPFALTGREVLQLGQGHYKVIHGTMTSCRLPKPDWRILARTIQMNRGVASAKSGMFELFRMPVMYLPYVTHPMAEQRESGILLPYYGFNTTYGQVVGTGYYQTLGRSADLTMGTVYYSKRGWAPNGMFRYRGLGQNFANVHFRSLLDHGLLEPNGTRVNQGGVDLGADGKYEFTPNTTGVIDTEYLSSYLFRLVFEEEYAIAINSEVKSQIFVTHEKHDLWESLRLSRYQNFESDSIPGDEIRILHLPEIDVDTADQRLGRADGLAPLWGLRASAGALSRYDYPSFRTTAEIPRVDFYPRLSMPLHFDGWTLRPQAAFRETWYGKSQDPAGLNQIPVVVANGISRTDEEAGLDIRPPALERDFTTPWIKHLLGGDLRHTLEPDIEYRYVTGIDNFRQILRFDEADTASDTNQLEYGLTQRLFLRHLPPHPCKGDNALGPDPLCGVGTRDWITWRVAQEHYFNPDFGGAVTRGAPNPLEATLDFTGVDFLTEPRAFSPVISRLRVATTPAADLEWDLDYDTKEGKITSSNIYAEFREGLYRLQFGDAYVNVPLGATPLSTAPPAATASPNAPEQFNQIHLLATHGAATKLGLSEGVGAAYDLVHQQLQYGAAQVQYNLNCCGFDFQYRRFSLGGIRDDTEYFYSVNFAGMANLGPLTHRISLF